MRFYRDDLRLILQPNPMDKHPLHANRAIQHHFLQGTFKGINDTFIRYFYKASMFGTGDLH